MQNSDTTPTRLTLAAWSNTRPVAMLRDLLKLNADQAAIPLEEVEPVEAILKRFDSAGMSLGPVAGGARGAGRGDEPPGRPLQLR